MNCIICSNSLIEYAPTSYLNLPVYYCDNCDLYATGNSEDEVKTKLIENYQEAKWVGDEGYQVMLKSNYTDEESLGKKRQWISQFAYCELFLKNKKNFFEIGSGAGQTICWFEDKGFSVIGIEPNKRSVELINKRLKNGRCITGFAEDVSINERFDIIWLSHVFEHILRPDLFLEKCKKNLEPDGIIFIEIPNCENKEILQCSIDEPSTFHFSKQALEKIAKKVGYRIIRSDYFRSPTLFEGGLNRIMKKYLGFIKNPYPYYPKIVTNSKRGTDIRIILKTNEN